MNTPGNLHFAPLWEVDVKVTKLWMLLIAGLLLAGCGAPRGGGGGGGGNWSLDDDDSAADDDDDDDTGVAVKGLDIDSITFNQGVEIPLMENGEEVGSRNAPVVEGRDGILRVYLDRQDEWQPRAIKVYLEFEEGDSPDPVEIFVDGDSRARQLDSTANFDIDAVPSELHFQVRLEEVESDVEAEGDDNESQWPEEGYADLNPRDPRGPLTIQLIPVRYGADGSDRMPDTSDAQLDRFRDAFMQRYPVAEVDVSIGSTLLWNTSVEPTGQGWSELLDAVLQRRWDESPDRDVYYYGLFSPALSITSYCSTGCIAGLSPLNENPNDDWGRASIGLGFPGEGAASTMVHEVGHAHGREHAPCGLFGQASDSNYPYSNASIGVWGYDILGRSLQDPDDYTDFMGYCEPTWVSDYSYDELFDRVRAVNNLDHFVAAPDAAQHWLVLSSVGTGAVRRAGQIQRALPPSGEQRTVTLLDSRGTTIGDSIGYFSPLNHLPGGYLLLPEPGPKVRALLLPDGSTLGL